MARALLSSPWLRYAGLLVAAVFQIGSSCSADLNGQEGDHELPPEPGLPAWQRLTAVRVPGGLVNAAGTNLLISRVDLSLDTRLGPRELGATWNSADATWRWSFDMSYDGELLVDATGARYDASFVPDGERIPGSVWVRVDGDTVKSVGGLVHEFDADGRLEALHWSSGAYPRVEYVSQEVAGTPRTTAVRQCRTQGACSDVFAIAYDGAGRVVTVSDRAGRTADFAYDAAGRLVAARDGLDTEQGWPGARYEYDALGRLIALTSSEDERVEYAYWGDGAAIRTVRVVGSGRERVHHFERVFREDTRYTAPDGSLFRFDCDPQRRLRELMLPTGGIVAWEWVPQGLDVVRRTLPDGVETLWEHVDDDELNRTDPSGNRVEIDFRMVGGENRKDPFRRPVDDIQDDLGLVERRGYSNGRLVWVENGEGERTSFQYHGEGDDENLPSRVILPSGVQVELSDYGEHGHPTRVVVDGESEERVYDAVGNLVSVRGSNRFHLAEGGLLTRTWDADRNLAAVELVDTDAAGAATTSGLLVVTWRSDGRPLRIERPHGGDHVFDYDDLGRLAARRERVDGAWRTTTFAYDAAGRRTAETLPNGMRRETTWDGAGRPRERRRLRSGVVEGTATFTWWQGRLVSVEDSIRGGVETHTYDAAGRLVATDFGDGNRLEREYDLRSREVVERYVTPAGTLAEIGRTHDLADREVRLDADGVPFLSKTWQDGRPTATTYGNGLVRSLAYEAGSGFLAGATTTLGSETVETTAVAVEVLGAPERIEVRADTATAGALAATTSEAYGLGPVDGPGAPAEAGAGRRVFSASADGAAAGTLAHDVLGNLVARAPGGGGPALALVYNAERNRLLRVEEAATGAPVVTYAYDAAGYVTARGGQAIAWTADGHVAALGSEAAFQWDLQGRPVHRVVGLAERQLPFGGRVEADAAGVPLRLDLGEVVLHLDTGAVRYRHRDFRGNVKLVSDETGQVAAHYRYGPYGATERLGSSEDAATFAGGRLVGDLVVLGGRLHDPLAGRFLAPDPVLQLASQHVYAFGNPLWFWDPSGLEPESGPMTQAQQDFIFGTLQVGVGLALINLALVPAVGPGIAVTGVVIALDGFDRMLEADRELKSEREGQRSEGPERKGSGATGPASSFVDPGRLRYLHVGGPNLHEELPGCPGGCQDAVPAPPDFDSVGRINFSTSLSFGGFGF